MTSIEFRAYVGRDRVETNTSTVVAIPSLGRFESRHGKQRRALILDVSNLKAPELLITLDEGSPPHELGTDGSGKRWEVVHHSRRNPSQT